MLTFSRLRTTPWLLRKGKLQDKTAQNVQSDFESRLSESP